MFVLLLGMSLVGNVIPTLICWSLKNSLMSRFRGSPGRDNMDQRAPVEKLGSTLRAPLKSGISQGTVPHTFFLSTDSQIFGMLSQ